MGKRSESMNSLIFNLLEAFYFKDEISSRHENTCNPKVILAIPKFLLSPTMFFSHKEVIDLLKWHSIVAWASHKKGI